MLPAVADVLLITDDSHLREAVAQHRRPGVRLQSISPSELTAGRLPQSRQVWLDLDATKAVPAASGARRIYFHSQRQTLAAKLPPGLFVRKPCHAAVLEVLWAGVDVKSDKSSPQSEFPPAARSLPAWLLDFHELDLKALCRKCVTSLGLRLGYKDVSLYLYDSEHGLLTLAETTHKRPIDLAVRCDTDEPSLMAAVARGGRMLHTDRVGQELAARRIKQHLDRPYTDDGCLVVPLASTGQLLGVLSFSGRFHTPQTEVGLPLDNIFAFLARALEHARAYDRARLEARVDSLTGLYNQRWTVEALEREIHRADRFSTPLAVLMLDLDGLKAVNDRAGHAAGDCLLRHVAARISSVLRQFDGAARVGGDEFVVTLPGTDLQGALQVGRRLLQSIRDDVAHFESCPLPITASAGAAEWRQGWDARQLIEAADQAMYTAKAQGRNTVVCQPPQPAPACLPARGARARRATPKTRFADEPPGPEAGWALPTQVENTE